jgi:hypothetical protein
MYNSDFINGGKGYEKIADFVILSPSNFNFNILKQNCIIFCKTDYIDFLFENIKFSGRKYVLITHYSDYHIDRIKFSRKPPCIKKWYASAVSYDHPDLIQIPIGFGVHWVSFPTPNEEYQKWFFDNAEKLSIPEKDNKTVYCNYTIDKFRPPREDVIKKLMDNNVDCYTPPDNPNRKDWKLDFPDYCKDMARFKFIASPPGNGIDTHRNWEAFYIGGIPIVINNLIYKNYNLPFYIINDYSEITPKSLEEYLEFYNTHNFNYEQATLSYWKNRMLEDLKNI